MAEVLWRHPDPTATPMWHFLQKVKQKHGLKEDTYESLYGWSVENVGDFWEECWDFVGIEASVPYEKVRCLGDGRGIGERFRIRDEKRLVTT